MKTMRVFFKKTGRAAYISHLDLSRTMQRAIKRAGLPVWYTEGFNPHIYLTFALPLSLGHQGLHESMDLRITEDMTGSEIVDRLNKALPDGLFAVSASEAQMKPDGICFARYRIILALPEDFAPGDTLNAFLEQDDIKVEKSTKKGKVLIDIRPDIGVEEYKTDGQTITVTMVLPAGGQKNINPALFVRGLETFTKQDATVREITRLAVLDEKMQDFA